ncbi:hypothetical protein DFJ77DRAFT_456496 [Powellomyces hirtus]|nr:hypothetical protein DFJ77DRAFT_456496 [Powellomyces hirtus]
MIATLPRLAASLAPLTTTFGGWALSVDIINLSSLPGSIQRTHAWIKIHARSNESCGSGRKFIEFVRPLLFRTLEW